MTLLFLPLLLTAIGLGRAEFPSDGVDCKRTMCFIFVDCYGHVEQYADHVIEAILRRPDEHNNFCMPFRIQMIIEIDARSAHRFDFRVLYNDTLPTEHLYFNLTGLVDITPGGVKRKKGDIYTEMPTSSVSRLGDFYVGVGGYFSGLYSYRFTLNGGFDDNLFVLLKQAKYEATFISGKPYTKVQHVLNEKDPMRTESLDKFCDPSDIIDHCEFAAKGETCGKLNISSSRIENADECKMWYSNSSEQWLRVRDITCSNGFWTISHTGSWAVTAPVLYCGEREAAVSDGGDDSVSPTPSALKSRRSGRSGTSGPPVCESSKNTAVALTIVFAVYCALMFILVIVLFILLFCKMGKLSGPSKFKVVRMKGTRDRKSKSKSKSSTSRGSSSGSASSSEGKNLLGKETPGLALNRTVSYKKGKKPSKKASGLS